MWGAVFSIGMNRGSHHSWVFSIARKTKAMSITLCVDSSPDLEKKAAHSQTPRRQAHNMLLITDHRLREIVYLGA